MVGRIGSIDPALIFNQRRRKALSDIEEWRATQEREQDPNRALTFFEEFGFEEDSDKDRLDALESISTLFGDPSYALGGVVTRNTQEQAEQIRNFLRETSKSTAAGETGMADRVMDLVSAGDFGFESIERLQNPQEFSQDSIAPIPVTSERFDRLPRPVLSNDSIPVTSKQFDRLKEPSNQEVPVGPAGRSDDAMTGRSDDRVTGRSDDAMSGRSLLRKALEASRKPIDMQRFEQLAQDRQRAGDLSMITSLAAGEAGPRYSGYQESYLKKALGEQGQQELGDYGFASGGEFYETPGIQQARGQKANLDASKLLLDAENDLLAREQAERRLEIQERAYDPTYATKSQRNKNSDFLNKRKTKAVDAQRALGQIESMREALGTADQGLFAPISNAVNSAFAEFKGASGAKQKTIAANVAQAIANAFGIDKLSQIGGNDTERELAIAISTAFQMTNQEEANIYLLNKLEEEMTKTVLRSQFSDQWSARFTTVNNINPLTGESYIVAEEKFLQEQTPKRLGRKIEGTSIFGLFDDNQENPPAGAGENDSELENVVNRYGLSR